MTEISLAKRNAYIRIYKKKVATVKALAQFWNDAPFNFIYRYVLKHRFPPLEVAHRFHMLMQRKAYRY